MGYETTIVCLAKSRKMSGFCVAGKVLTVGSIGSWVRPVSARVDQEIQPTDCDYQGGGEPILLDIISMALEKHVPHGHQAENHLINAALCWQKRARFPWKDMTNLLDPTSSLWLNGESTFHGCNDRIAEALETLLTTSLLLIEPEQVEIRVLAPSERFGDATRKVRARFRFKGIGYDLMVTDPTAEAVFLTKSDGTYPLGQKAFMCISLADKPVRGHFYKLVAAIITERSL